MRKMFDRLAQFFSIAACVAYAATAQASFHEFTIDEVYSDASGAVQYIRLTTTFPSQQFVQFQSITASQGVNANTFQFPNNLPGDTMNKKFLVATQGFAALGTVTPDYIVPNNFLFQPGGTINFASVDSVTYASLPTNGTHAIDRNGNVVVAAPTNFAGSTASVNVPPPVAAGPMDIDQNGAVDALTDGLLLLRYAFGLRDAALVQGAIGTGAARNTAALIQAYLASCIGVGATCGIP